SSRPCSSRSANDPPRSSASPRTAAIRYRACAAFTSMPREAMAASGPLSSGFVIHRGEAMRTTEAPLLARITRWALRFRRSVLVAWLVLLIAGGFASMRLSALLSDDFGVPGTDSARAATILARHFGDLSDGEYLLVFATGRTIAP